MMTKCNICGAEIEADKPCPHCHLAYEAGYKHASKCAGMVIILKDGLAIGKIQQVHVSESELIATDIDGDAVYLPISRVAKVVVERGVHNQEGGRSG